MHYNFGIARALEYSAVVFERAAQSVGVRYKSVFRKAYRTLAVTRGYRLNVFAQILAEIIADVSQPYLTFERFYRARVKYFVDVSVIFDARQLVIIVGNDTAADMSAVLKRKQRVTKLPAHVSAAEIEHTDHAAFFFHVIGKFHSLSCKISTRSPQAEKRV